MVVVQQLIFWLLDRRLEYRFTFLSWSYTEHCGVPTFLSIRWDDYSVKGHSTYAFFDVLTGDGSGELCAKCRKALFMKYLVLVNTNV